MEKTILMISRGSTFMVDAIIQNLKGAGFDIKSCEPATNAFRDHIDDADILLFYLGNFVDEIKEPLVYLKDLCIEKEKILNVIGDAGEVDILKQSIPEHLIENVFSRPLDMKKLIDVLNGVAQKNDENSRKKSILLVDDDPAFLNMVKGWLSEKYRVTIVSSGMQAITFIAKNTPDLILLDYEMPVTTGPQVLEMIRSEVSSEGIPVIFLTGKGDKESVTKVLSLKPNGYILKTVGKEKLLSQIDDFFEGKKAKQY